MAQLAASQRDSAGGPLDLTIRAQGQERERVRRAGSTDVGGPPFSSP